MAQRARPATALAVAARFLNVEDWDPLPGMIKRQCPRCRYLFVDSEELRCPGLRRPGETAAPHASGNSTPLGPVVRRGAHDVGHRPGKWIYGVDRGLVPGLVGAIGPRTANTPRSWHLVSPEF